MFQGGRPEAESRILLSTPLNPLLLKVFGRFPQSIIASSSHLFEGVMDPLENVGLECGRGKGSRTRPQ